MKKIVSIIMTLLMLLLSGISVYASSEIAVLQNSKMDFYKNLFEGTGTKVYVVDDAVAIPAAIGEDTYVVMNELANGDIEILSVEGDIRDHAIFKKNGDIILNGSEVLIETEMVISEESNIPSTELLVPYGQRYNRWQNNCPYGTHADYIEVASFRTNMTFERALREISLNIVLAAVVDRAVPSHEGYPATPNLAALQDYIEEDIRYIIDLCVAENSPKRILCVETFKHVHGTLGEYINGEYVYQWWFAYYKDTSYNDETSLFTFDGPRYNLILTD